MKLKKRLLIYSIFFIIYWLVVIGILRFSDFFSDVYTAVIIAFSILNILYTFLFLKLHIILNILSSIAVAYISLFAALAYVDYGYYPKNSDPYGIVTAITCIALFSIILWEIIYQLKIKRTPANTR